MGMSTRNKFRKVIMYTLNSNSWQARDTNKIPFGLMQKGGLCYKFYNFPITDIKASFNVCAHLGGKLSQLYHLKETFTRLYIYKKIPKLIKIRN